MANTARNEAALRLYRAKAAGYDASAARTMPLRRRAVALLDLQPGQVVLDAGAGTGLSYGLLLDGVGTAGRVLAFEQSPDMFAHACARVQREGWEGVWHVHAAAEDVRLPVAPDAVLFNYVHDIVRSPAALANIMRQLRPGARVVVAGMKYFPWWTGPLNLYAWLKNRPYNTHAAQMWRPWDLLAAHCESLVCRSTQCGMGYLGYGRARPATSRTSSTGRVQMPDEADCGADSPA